MLEGRFGQWNEYWGPWPRADRRISHSDRSVMSRDPGPCPEPNRFRRPAIVGALLFLLLLHVLFLTSGTGRADSQDPSRILATETIRV